LELALCHRGRAEPAPPRPRSATRRTGGPKRGSAPVRRDADITGVRSPPLRETGTPDKKNQWLQGRDAWVRRDADIMEGGLPLCASNRSEQERVA
jgi:hypothetical protein